MRNPTFGYQFEETKAVLPGEGERLTFGVHRLAWEDRQCPMWPLNFDGFGRSNASYRNWVKGATKGAPEVVTLLARVKAGEVPNEVAATIVVRNSRPVTWVTEVEAAAARAAIQDAWLRGDINIDEARRRADLLAA